MDYFQRMPDRFPSWSYYGALDDVDQDAHEALERAAESFLPHRQQPVRTARRGRPPRIPRAPRAGD
jgi:hypothetical protein